MSLFSHMQKAGFLTTRLVSLMLLELNLVTRKLDVHYSNQVRQKSVILFIEARKGLSYDVCQLCNEWADQTGQINRLICTIVVHIG